MGPQAAPSKTEADKDARPITAADLMNPDVLTVPEDMTVQELARFLRENEISGAPVEDEDGKLVGVVSLSNVAEAAAWGELRRLSQDDFYSHAAPASESELRKAEERLQELGQRVSDIMTPSVHSVTPETEVAEIASRMLHAHLHRLLVCEKGRLVGIVSTSDLLGLLVQD